MPSPKIMSLFNFTISPIIESNGMQGEKYFVRFHNNNVGSTATMFGSTTTISFLLSYVLKQFILMEVYLFIRRS